MKFTAEQIAELIKGEIIGNSKSEVDTLCKIEEGKQGGITFLAQEKYLSYLHDTKASIVIISKKLLPETKVNTTLIVVDDAYSSFNTLLQYYAQFRNKKTGIEEPNFISKSSKLGDNLYIGSFVYIDENVIIGSNTSVYPNSYIGANVHIGKNVIIEPNVVINTDCIIGNNCIIHSGTVIGSDGFGFAPTANGFEKIPQLGNVILEDNVEIGSNCTIDRATMGSTIIRKGTKLDNLIQIAHNVEMGENNVIAAQTGIAGSTKIGNWNMIGGQVGIVGHLKIGNQNQIQAKSGINKDIKDNEQHYGAPSMDAMLFRKNYVHFKNLSEIVKRLDELEKIISTNTI